MRLSEFLIAYCCISTALLLVTSRRVSSDLKHIVARARISCKVTPRHARAFLVQAPNGPASLPDVGISSFSSALSAPFRVLPLPFLPSLSTQRVCLPSPRVPVSQAYNPEIWARITWNSKSREATGECTRPNSVWTPTRINLEGIKRGGNVYYIPRYPLGN